MLKYGYPRNDILHRPDRDKIAADIKKKIGIPEDKKIILYVIEKIIIKDDGAEEIFWRDLSLHE